jgi:hypothetical protein
MMVIRELRELEGHGTLYFFAKGDHDPIEFAENLSALQPDIEVHTKYIRKEWWRWVPVGEKGMGVVQYPANQGECGAFLVTCYDAQVPFFAADRIQAAANQGKRGNRPSTKPSWRP